MSCCFVNDRYIFKAAAAFWEGPQNWFDYLFKIVACFLWMKVKDSDGIDKRVVIVYVFKDNCTNLREGSGQWSHKYWCLWVSTLKNSLCHLDKGECFIYQVFHLNSKQLMKCYKQINNRLNNRTQFLQKSVIAFLFWASWDTKEK